MLLRESLITRKFWRIAIDFCWGSAHNWWPTFNTFQWHIFVVWKPRSSKRERIVQLVAFGKLFQKYPIAFQCSQGNEAMRRLYCIAGIYIYVLHIYIQYMLVCISASNFDWTYFRFRSNSSSLCALTPCTSFPLWYWRWKVTIQRW